MLLDLPNPFSPALSNAMSKICRIKSPWCSLASAILRQCSLHTSLVVPSHFRGSETPPPQLASSSMGTTH